MRFMLLLKGDPPADPTGNAQPPRELIAAMLKFDEEMHRSGVLLAYEGLLPSVVGSRVVYSRGKRTVIDGPFTEAKELIAGFYLIQVRSKEEAIEWARRCPVELLDAVLGDQEAVIEVRQVAEAADLEAMTPELRAVDQRLREQLPSS
jgi:hypothetical protein